MGLDMYLSAEKFVSGYKHSNQASRDTFTTIVNAIGIPASEEAPSITIEVNVGYWRKANAIHNWFVTHVQDGIDECQESRVSREQLIELLETCKSVLPMKGTKQVPDKLPPQGGFFFGSTEINEGYWEDVEYTINIITKALAIDDVEFLYQASW